MNTARSAVRRLPLDHDKKIRGQTRPDAGGSDDSQDPPVPQMQPDYVQLYSRFVPTLQAGDYNVSITQTIKVPATSEQKTLSSQQKMTVSLPVRFSLTTGSIHSFYPHLGQTENANVLPHVVFTDPQLPWERHTGGGANDPWLALLAFEVDELRLPTSVLTGDNSIFHTKSSVEQSPSTWSIRLSLNDLFNTDSTTSPIKQNDSNDPVDGNTIADFIFLQNKLFTSIFTSRDSHGSAKSRQSHPYAGGFRYLAHVKNINTAGMAQAGLEADQGLYSVVISGRTAPVDLTQPTRMVAHLVSLEGTENMDFPPDSRYDYVALCSLWSWNYVCQPSSPANIIACLESIGGGVSPLRPPADQIKSLTCQPDQVAKRTGERLASGFTMTRYCVQSGDETAAITRGPCIPVPNNSAQYQYLNTMADFPTSLQILDQEVGFMDLSYSSAWQLGKSLALADQTFATAFGRLRMAAYQGTIKEAKSELAAAQRSDKPELLNDLSSIIAGIEDLCDEDSSGSIPAEKLRRRWQATTDTTTNLRRLPKLDMRELRSHLKMLELHANEILAKLAATGDSGDPESTDWLVVLNWVLDKMFLNGIPSQYLISDPSFLPPENIRFFHVDPLWMDALIDGALSLGNHLEPDDFVRKSIKGRINTYLDTVDPDLGYKPQIPCYGFFLRSTIVSAVPDLVVRAPLPENDPRCPIIRQSLLDTDILLCLFDRIPSADVFPTLTFTRPPHQQGFFAADSITSSQFQVVYRKICTDADSTSSAPSDDTWTKGSTSPDNTPYDWDSRCLIMDNYAQAVFSKLSAESYFNDTSATPEMMGIQLGGDVFDLTIRFQDSSASSSSDDGKNWGGYRPSARPIRTLRLLEYPTWTSRAGIGKRAPKPTHEPPVPEARRAKTPLLSTESDDESSDDESPPGRRHLSGLLPQPSIISNNGGTLLRFHAPFFSISIFPISYAYAGGILGLSSVPGPSAFANDLVIALNVLDNAFANDPYLTLWIQSLVIRIPYGNNQEGCLIQWPMRTVGSMISNRAFHLQFSRTQDSNSVDVMEVKVVPKFGTPKINDWVEKKIGLSWILSGVYTSEGSQKATVQLEENYTMDDPLHDGKFMHVRSTIDVTIG